MLFSSCQSCNLRAVVLAQIFQGLLRHLRIPDVAKHLVMHTRREAVQHSAHCLFPHREVLVCRLRRYFTCSFYITPIIVPQQVLVHLVRPRCIIVPVKLFGGKWARHASVHFSFLSLFFPSVRSWFVCTLCQQYRILNPRALIPCDELHAEACRHNRLRPDSYRKWTKV